MANFNSWRISGVEEGSSFALSWLLCSYLYGSFLDKGLLLLPKNMLQEAYGAVGEKDVQCLMGSRKAAIERAGAQAGSWHKARCLELWTAKGCLKRVLPTARCRVCCNCEAVIELWMQGKPKENDLLLRTQLRGDTVWNLLLYLVSLLSHQFFAGF